MFRTLACLALISCSSSSRVVAPPRRSSLPYAVEGLQSASLFRDEAARTRTALAAFLEARGVEVWPEATQTRAWALAAEGRNPLTGQACGLPLSGAAAVRRWAPVLGLAGSASAYTSCEQDGGCRLHLETRDRSGHEVPGTALEGPWLPDPNVDLSFERALPLLTTAGAAPRGGGLVGGLGMRGTGPVVVELQRDDKLSLRADVADLVKSPGPDAPSLAQLDQPQTHACFGPAVAHVSVLTEFDERGALTRCEAQSLDLTGGTCLCERVRAAGLQSLAGHRWRLSASLDRRDLTTTDERFILSARWDTFLVRDPPRPGETWRRMRESVEDDSLRGWSPGPARLAALCFTDLTEAKTISSRWAVWFDAKGSPTKATEQKGHPPLTKSAAECIQRALMTGQAPCPARAQLWAMADLSIHVAEIGAPRAGR